MGDVDFKAKLNIVLICIPASFLVFFIIYTVFARMLGFIDLSKFGESTLFLIIIGMQFISFIASILVGRWQTDDMEEGAVLKASIMAFLVNFVVIAALSYFSLFYYYPYIFNEVKGFELFWIYPEVLVDFSIYILGHPINLIILNIISYYLFFIIFLEKFYEFKY